MHASIHVAVDVLTTHHRSLPGTARRFTAAWAVALAACVGLSGCSSGEYTRRMDETTKKLQKLGDIAAVIYYDPSPVNDAAGRATGIRLRLPLIIDGNAKSMTGNDPAAQPPFMELPGLAYSYEIQMGGQTAFAYFASVAADEEKTAEVVAQEVQAALRGSFSSATWTDTALETPDGGSVTVKLMSVTGSQKFSQDVEDGRFDLYLVSSATHHVLIGWRAPVVAGTTAGFFDNAARALGSVQGTT